MNGSGAVKYLQINKSYLIRSTLDDNIYFLLTSVAESADLYAQVATLRNAQNERFIVLFDKNAEQIDVGEQYIWDDYNWDSLTNWISNYNGQTVYFEPDLWDGIIEIDGIIP